GYPAEQVRRLVRVGDMVTLKMEPVELMNDVVAGKTMDDRASIYAMLETARTLSRMDTGAQVYYVASSQEEVGSKGAMTAAWSIHPDLAIAIDVTFGKDPGASRWDWDTFPLDKVVLAVGPNIHPMLGKKLQDVAKKYHVACAQEIFDGPTGTDAAEIQVARGGIPCVLVSIPLKYMHTTVETIKTETVKEAGRLMAMFIDEISREWEDLKWY
ncbi:MAG: M20/M25/M40 family metallo-hydrolase, partial [Clostridia bacterium]|nr:M20/M25/M40 family metallo-hydrolase [Clostridia bacterium]